jgi:hypothetical protein
VAGAPGAHYAILIRNHLGERLLAVTSVDGINVISGQSAKVQQSGYVLDAWESYQVTGWRKSDYQVAAFNFTVAPQSYASRTDRPENIGVIGIALFREQPAETSLAEQPAHIANREPDSAPPSAAENARRAAEAPAPSALESKPADAAANAIASSPVAPALGTGHGEREYSYVAHTRFMRLHEQPDETVRIRYDSFEHLVAMGIIRTHPYRGWEPNPFPGADPRSYVPDPPPGDSP